MPIERLDAREGIAHALRDSEERFRFLAESVPVQIWTALPDGNLDYVTEQTGRHFGLSAAALLASGWQNVVHPEDLPLAGERWTRSLTTGEPYSIEFRLKLASGEFAWHLARAVAQRDESGKIVRWFGTNTNIEEQREQRRHVQELHDAVASHADDLRERGRLLALQADVGVALTRSASRADALVACAEALVRHLDVAFARIWTLDERAAVLELRASAGLYTHLDGPHSRIPLGTLKIGQIAAERKPLHTNQVVGDSRVGDQEWAKREGMVSFAGYPLVVAGKLVGVVAAFARRPMSTESVAALESIANGLAIAIERLRVEAERERLLAITEDARQRAELASRAKDEFLATASHELRTPLNAILGWARMLRTESLDAASREKAAETIERNARAQVRLIEDILDGSRIITGKLHLEIQSVDLGAVVSAAMDAVRPAAAAKKIAIAIELDRAGARMKGDPDRLQQIVWNLVNNAIKFTPRGGSIRISLMRVGTSIELAIADTGEGIAAEFLPLVFERFRQADGSSTRRHGGLGLGLALVRHLVEAHGGTVRVASPGEGKGATFVVTLPVQAVFPEISEPPMPAAHVDGVATPAEGMSLLHVRVLVVDDERDASSLVATVLRMHGAAVTVADTVERALEVLEAEPPTVLVSDIGMPGADGYELISRARALTTSASSIPALALTAYAREEDRRRALSAGFQMYLAKPADPDALVRAVHRLAAGRGEALPKGSAR